MSQEHFIAVGLFFSSRRMAFNDIVNLSLEEGIVPADMNNIIFAKAVCKCNTFYYTPMMLLY